MATLEQLCQSLSEQVQSFYRQVESKHYSLLRSLNEENASLRAQLANAHQDTFSCPRSRESIQLLPEKQFLQAAKARPNESWEPPFTPVYVSTPCGYPQAFVTPRTPLGVSVRGDTVLQRLHLHKPNEICTRPAPEAVSLDGLSEASNTIQYESEDQLKKRNSYHSEGSAGTPKRISHILYAASSKELGSDATNPLANWVRMIVPMLNMCMLGLRRSQFEASLLIRAAWEAGSQEQETRAVNSWLHRGTGNFSSVDLGNLEVLLRKGRVLGTCTDEWDEEELASTRSRIVQFSRKGLIEHESLADLLPVRKNGQKDSESLRSLLRRLSRESICSGLCKTADSKEKVFWRSALLSLVLGVFSIVPFSLMLARDPGSPLFISFGLHIFIVASHIGNAGKFLLHRRIPLVNHAAIIVLGFLFNTLKCDAFSRLPTSTCMLLMNLRMLVGATVQRALLGKRYSSAQKLGCFLVTIGVAHAGWSLHDNDEQRIEGVRDLLIGTFEILGSLLALTLLSLVSKHGFSKYGEHVDEQLFIQHLCSLPLFLNPRQWKQIGPRLYSWSEHPDALVLALLFASNVAFSFGSRWATVHMSGRAPNVLMVQLVQTLEKFTQTLVTGLLHAPPWPPRGFWVGSGILALGTVRFLCASEPSQDRVSRR